MPDTRKKDGNSRREEKRLVRQRMTVSGMVVLVAVVAVVLIFHLLNSTERKEIAAATDTQVTTTGGVKPKESVPADKAEDSGSADRIYYIEGNAESSNPYMKVDKLAYTNTCLYTEEDLLKLEADGLKLTRNEIYARHGRMFYEQPLQEYFESQSWYVPRYTPDNFDEACLNKVEKANLEKLLEIALR